MKRVLLTVVLAAAGCSSQEQSNARGEPAAVTPAETSASRPPAKAESSGTASGTSEPKKEQRGNTPPGQTRAGEAPAAGAIADPSGATKR